MAEYIDRGTAIAKLTALEVTEPSATMAGAKRLIADMPAAVFRPDGENLADVQGKLCEWKEIVTD